MILPILYIETHPNIYKNMSDMEAINDEFNNVIISMDLGAFYENEITDNYIDTDVTDEYDILMPLIFKMKSYCKSNTLNLCEKLSVESILTEIQKD